MKFLANILNYFTYLSS